MAAIRFLTVDDVLTLHQNTIEIEGGAGGLRDVGLLQSAVLMPQQRFGGEYLHPDLPAMAAAYLFHLAQNHAFHDGNKRTAALAALVFLKVNGIDSLPDPKALEKMIWKGAKGQSDKAEVTAWMRLELS